MSNKRRALTADEQAALARYIAEHGRYWKADVRHMWETSNPRTDDEVTIYRLRNEANFGPRWLIRYKPDLNAVGHAERERLAERQPTPEQIAYYASGALHIGGIRVR